MSPQVGHIHGPAPAPTQELVEFGRGEEAQPGRGEDLLDMEAEGYGSILMGRMQW